MRKVLAICICLVVARAVSCFAGEWESIGAEHRNIKAILADRSGKRIYIGTDKGIFASDDNGMIWKDIFLSRLGRKQVNYLVFGDNNDSVYAATNSGVFCSNDMGKSWTRIFKGRNEAESNCLAVMLSAQCIYVGTKAGLFISTDSTASWQKVIGEIDSSGIVDMARSAKQQNCIYSASANCLFRSCKDPSVWEKIFTISYKHRGEEENIPDNDSTEDTGFRINKVALDIYNPGVIYLATSRGVYKSSDDGLSWDKLPSFGLIQQNVNCIFVSKYDIVYASTDSSVFMYDAGTWQDISVAVDTGRVNALACINNNLYAAGDDGLFYLNVKNLSTVTAQQNLSLYLENEPRIRDVQLAAIKYAEVEPEKISRWRKQAQNKAFLPKVSASVSRDTSDLFHWESGSSTRMGDDVLLQGKDVVGWGVTISWDLGEIIWNADQTSIDTRSKLMVELRDDVLNEVTKLYFERTRLKMEIDGLKIEDSRKRMEKELKLQEVTASLDSLTGGYFTNRR